MKRKIKPFFEVDLQVWMTPTLVVASAHEFEGSGWEIGIGVGPLAFGLAVIKVR